MLHQQWALPRPRRRRPGRVAVPGAFGPPADPPPQLERQAQAERRRKRPRWIDRDT